MRRHHYARSMGEPSDPLILYMHHSRGWFNSKGEGNAADEQSSEVAAHASAGAMVWARLMCSVATCRLQRNEQLAKVEGASAEAEQRQHEHKGCRSTLLYQAELRHSEHQGSRSSLLRQSEHQGCRSSSLHQADLR